MTVLISGAGLGNDIPLGMEVTAKVGGDRELHWIEHNQSLVVMWTHSFPGSGNSHSLPLTLERIFGPVESSP